jgi:hypothetical protein
VAIDFSHKSSFSVLLKEEQRGLPVLRIVALPFPVFFGIEM